MDFVNMTPHTINVLHPIANNDDPTDIDYKTLLTIEPSGETIRLSENWTVIGSVGNIALYHCAFGSEAELPPEQDNRVYVVSAMVANAFPERTDFVMVAKTVRDENGYIMGCEAFASATL